MINHKLKGLRTQNNFNQTQLAELLNISTTSYNRKENGKDEFTLEEIKKLIAVLEVPFEDIFLHTNYTER